jgi:hypothetical protein
MQVLSGADRGRDVKTVKRIVRSLVPLGETKPVTEPVGERPWIGRNNRYVHYWMREMTDYDGTR